MSYNFRGICRSVFQSLFQRLYAGWLNKQSESLVPVVFFYVESADNVDIENNIFPRVENPFHFAFQSAVELPGIDFFIFQKFVVRYTFAKFIGCDEIIFDAVFSVPLGARLVAEIENDRFKSRFNNDCMMVDLPEPEGAEKIMSLPLCSITLHLVLAL